MRMIEAELSTSDAKTEDGRNWLRISIPIERIVLITDLGWEPGDKFKKSFCEIVYQTTSIETRAVVVKGTASNMQRRITESKGTQYERGLAR